MTTWSRHERIGSDCPFKATSQIFMSALVCTTNKQTKRKPKQPKLPKPKFPMSPTLKRPIDP